MTAERADKTHYDLAGIPSLLKEFDLWAPYTLVLNESRGKYDKIPKTLTGYGLSSSEPKKWFGYPATVAALARNPAFAGPGFCIKGAKGQLIAVDLDNCLNAPWALDVIRELDSYTELSPSGKGYRIFLQGSLAEDWMNHDQGIEVYGGNAGRFVTVTGWRLPGVPEDVRFARHGALAAIESRYRKAKSSAAEVIDLTLPDLLDEGALPALASIGLPAEVRRFLMDGEFGDDRSGTLFACGVSLYAAGLSDAAVLSILFHNPYAWQVALDHRRHDDDRALLYLWREHCLKAKPKGAKAVAAADEFEVVPVPKGEKPLPPFARDKHGAIEATIGNLHLALLRPDICGMYIRFDLFRDEIMFAPFNDPTGFRPFRDCDYVELRLVLERGRFKPIGRELIRDVVAKVAEDNAFDSAITWLDSLRWDGVPRVDAFLITHFGAEDTPYARAVSRYLWSGLAGRICTPGVKADMVPILVGDQGIKKSSSVAAMVPSPEFFTEISFGEKDDDLSRKMRGCLLAEIGELRGLHTKELEAIKAFITRQFENWIPKFKEFRTTFPRRLMFIGTTNQPQFLADETGNRRWLPIKVSMADIDAIRRDRLQLWAEASVLYAINGVLFEDAERLGRDEHEEFALPERWHCEITEWLDTPDSLSGEKPADRKFLRVADIARECLRIEPAKLERKDESQIGKVLRVLGYERRKVRTDGRVVWGFVPLCSPID